jgi:hypothetical protein
MHVTVMNNRTLEHSNYKQQYQPKRSWDSSVGIATGWTARVRFPAGAKDLSPLHSNQIGSGAKPASYPIGTEGSLAVVKPAGA